MYIKKTILSFYTVSIALLLILAGTPAYAEIIGKITFIDGRVDMLKSDLAYALPVEKGALVSLKDIIRTKSGSRAEITINDGTVIRLAQGSRVEMTGFTFDESGAAKSATLNLLRGKIRTISPREISDFQVLTPNAKGDRISGKDFVFIYEKGSTWFYGSGGTLQASGIADPTQVISVSRRNCVRVAAGVQLKDSCVFNDIDEKKHEWDTAATESVPVIAQLPSEGEVYTYTPLSGKAIDTPSMPVTVAFDDLTCPQCRLIDVPLVPVEQTSPTPAPTPTPTPPTKMGDFDRIDKSNGI